jgi:subtilisin family serine protease
MAPEAKLYLLKIEDEIHFYEAFDFCNDNGIDIISLSIGTFGSGPGDGTGPLADLCNFAMENGILVVAAAGNQANFSSNGTLIGTHWEGVFLDQGDNDWWADGSNDVHRFVPNELSSRYNVIAAEPYRDDDGNPETDDLTVLLRWDDWPYADIDYDIYLFNYYTGALVAYSNYVQNGAQQPLEAIILDLPDSENYWHYYYLVVAKPNGEPVGTKIELYLGGQSFFMPFWPYSSPIATSSSSIIEPADAQSVLTVGAIGYGKWTTGPQEDFSSQGPTNAWAGSIARVKPDICGPDGVSGYSYGPSSFFGTSAATPHVAGAAALILSMFPNLSHDQLRTIIESSAIDMGATGKDNLFGWGRLNINVHFDIDGSGIFEIKDAILALQICAGISPGSKIYKEADIDGDGRIGLKEAVFTLQIVSGSRFD